MAVTQHPFLPRGLLPVALLLATSSLASSQPADAATPPTPPPEASAPAPELLQTPPRSVVLAVDTSGSMAINDPTARIRGAIRQVLDGLSERDQVGLVTFDTTARAPAPLRPLSRADVRPRIEAAVRGLRFNGRYTDIPVAVERSLYELQGDADDGRSRIIVLVTDGIIDTGDEEQDRSREEWLRDDLLPSCREDGVRIFSVAFTEAADYELLRTASTRTGGGYYRALRPEDLPEIFGELDRAIARPLPALQPDPAVPAEPTVSVEEIEQAVERTVRELDAERPSPVPVVAESPSSNLLLIGLGLAAAALVIAAAALLLARRRDRDDLPLVKGSLHDLQNGRAHELDQRVTRIGRSPDSDIVIDSPTVSGRHAQIEARDGIYRLVDLRSTNGTFVNEHQIEGETLLRRGDVIRLDQFKFAFDGEEVDEETKIGGLEDDEKTMIRVSPWSEDDED